MPTDDGDHEIVAEVAVMPEALRPKGADGAIPVGTVSAKIGDVIDPKPFVETTWKL